MASSVHFYGTDNVVSAAENRNCPRWGIFNGRQFLFKYDGEDMAESLSMLEKILESLQASGTVAAYTIKFYEEKVKIKDNTPYDGSFNFRLVEEEEREQRRVMYSTQSKALEERMQRIEELLAPAGEEEDDEPEPDTIGGVLMGLLKEPAKIEQLISGVRNIFGGVKHAGAIGSTPPMAATGSDEAKVQQAIQVLKLHDPKIADHLLKLAGIATDKPDAFKYLLTMLDGQ